jgi:nucleoside-diphosphate-sugar epimerase
MNFVTGATGLLGSHIAEQLVQSGQPVRALVRPGSNTDFLRRLGVGIHLGRLEDADSLRSGMASAGVVFHAASKVGDWGEWYEFHRDVVEGTRNVLRAASQADVRRGVLVRSTSAYGHPPPGSAAITESQTLGQRLWLWDYYTRAKVLAERIAWEYASKTSLEITVIRPSWIYGPRDRTSIHRLAQAFASGWACLIGDGSNRINSVYAGNVAEACCLAADARHAAGEAYNVTSDGPITQAEYLNAFADALGLPRPRRRVPYRIAFATAFMLEAAYRTVGARRPPFITRYAVWLLGRDTLYDSRKAQLELGWQPRVGYAEGIRRAADWYRRGVPDAIVARHRTCPREGAG